MSSTAMRANSSDSSSPEQSDRESQSDEVLSEEEDDVSKDTQNAQSFPSDNYGGQEHKNYQQQGVANMLPNNGETLGQAPQLSLVGHSIACAPNPYYGGMMAAYGHPLGHPPFLDMQQARMPLPLEMAQEPVYVNAKQYHAILRRRQCRAKAELEKKLIKDRKPYLHESRHQHAMRRVRGTGGRFAKKTEVDSVKRGDGDDIKNTSSPRSVNSTGMKRVRSDSAESLETRNGRYMDNGDNYGGYRLDIGGGGDGVGQQWINISSNQASHRAVAMK